MDVDDEMCLEICLPQFKPGNDWNVYSKRLEKFFNATSVNDDARKISFLISTIGQEAYQLLRDLCDPVLPHNKTYEELCELMKKHYAFEKDDLSKFEKLPEECLIEIFNYLSIAERCRIERVCKRFEEASKNSWYEVKELRVDPKFLGLKPSGKRHQYADINRFGVRQILKRCGSYLTKIDSTTIFDCLLALVAEYCPNIQSLKFCCPSNEGLKKLTENCNNICELVIKHGGVGLEDTLVELFSVNKNLRILDVTKSYVTGKCLDKLPLREMLAIQLNRYVLVDLSNLIKNTKKLSVFKAEIKDAISIRDLGNCCSNLTSLDLDNDGDIESLDSLFSQVFRKNDNLKSLKLENFTSLTGECLLSLNKNNIEEICLEATYSIQGNYFTNSLPYFVKLHKVELFYLSGNNFNQIFESISLCSKLKTFHIQSVENCSLDKLIKSLSSSKNIESLRIRFMNEGVVIKSLFSDISSNLFKLKYLNLSCSVGITDNDLEPISNLPKLEELDISYNNNITGSVLVKFPRLKKLHVFGCDILEDDNIISFLRCAMNLELLDIRYCKKINVSVINAAIDVTKKRTNNLILEIRICKYQIDFNEIKDQSPLLHLEMN